MTIIHDFPPQEEWSEGLWPAVDGGLRGNEQVFVALASEEPLESVRRAVAQELKAGVRRDQILAELEELRTDLRRDGREEDEDVVLEVMDFLTGWSSPHMRL